MVSGAAAISPAMATMRSSALESVCGRCRSTSRSMTANSENAGFSHTEAMYSAGRESSSGVKKLAAVSTLVISACARAVSAWFAATRLSSSRRMRA